MNLPILSGLFGLPVLLATQQAQPVVSPQDASPEADSSTQVVPGLPSQFQWADFNDDALVDALVVTLEGKLMLLQNEGTGSFKDITLTSGLGGIEKARFASLHDFNSDGSLDLFCGYQRGPEPIASIPKWYFPRCNRSERN